MTHQLTDTQAFWLGHVFRAYSLGLPLSAYAEEQQLNFADLMRWRHRLAIQHVEMPPQHRPNRFVRVEVAS